MTAEGSLLIKTVLLCLPIHLEMSETNSNNLDIGHSKEESGATKIFKRCRSSPTSLVFGFICLLLELKNSLKSQLFILTTVIILPSLH